MEKTRPVETISGIGGEEDKGEWWRGCIQLWYVWYIVRTFVNVTMYHLHNNNNKKIVTHISNHPDPSVEGNHITNMEVKEKVDHAVGRSSCPSIVIFSMSFFSILCHLPFSLWTTLLSRASSEVRLQKSTALDLSSLICLPLSQDAGLVIHTLPGFSYHF
jgi:hypothetical protein